jgi:hypothetical protein
VCIEQLQGLRRLVLLDQVLRLRGDAFGKRDRRENESRNGGNATKRRHASKSRDKHGD